MLTAAGIGLSIVSSTIAATQGAREGQAGLASGLVNTSRQAGGGLGLALLITLATQYTTNLVGTDEPVSDALTQGFRLAYLIAAGWSRRRPWSPSRSCRPPSEEGGRVIHRRTLATVVALVVAALAGTYFAVAGKGAADRRLHDEGDARLRLGPVAPSAEDRDRATRTRASSARASS